MPPIPGSSGKRDYRNIPGDIAEAIVAVDNGEYPASISRNRQASELGISVCIFLFIMSFSDFMAGNLDLTK